MSNNRKQRLSVRHALLMSSQIGFTMAACIFVGVFSGLYLDKFFKTAPWLLLLFSLLGAAAAFWSIFRLSTKKKK